MTREELEGRKIETPEGASITFYTPAGDIGEALRRCGQILAVTTHAGDAEGQVARTTLEDAAACVSLSWLLKL